MISVSKSDISNCKKMVDNCLEITNEIINSSMEMLESTKQERQICAEINEKLNNSMEMIDSTNQKIEPLAEKPEKIRLFRLLYNNCCNYTFDDDFFSELFIKTYQEHYETDDTDIERYFIERNNPKIMKIYDLLGQEKSSKRDENGYLLSSLRVKYFPVELEKFMDIQIFEGREYIHIAHGKMYRSFYESVVMDNQPVEELKKYYQRLEYVYNEYKKGKDKFNDENIFVIE